MAEKPKPISHKQLLQLYQQGKSIKFIARSLGISKNTVKAYFLKVSSIIGSQLLVANWHDVIGEEAIAYVILDRLVHYISK